MLGFFSNFPYFSVHLSSEQEEAKLGKCEEHYEEHDGKARHVARAARERAGQLGHRLWGQTVILIARQERNEIFMNIIQLQVATRVDH